MDMADSRGSVEHRIVTLRGQLDGLASMLRDGEVSYSRAARLVRTIDGTWSSIRRATIKGWLDQVVDVLPEDDQDQVLDLVEALEHCTGTP